MFRVKRQGSGSPRFYSIGVVKDKPDIRELPEDERRKHINHWMMTDMEVDVSDSIKVEKRETLVVNPYSLGVQKRAHIKSGVLNSEVQIPDVIVQTQYSDDDDKEE